MKCFNILLVIVILSINSFACKKDTINYFNVRNDGDLKELKKKLKRKFIKGVIVYDYDLSDFDFVANILIEYRSNFSSLTIHSNRFNPKHEIIKNLELNSFAFFYNLGTDSTVAFPQWITELKSKQVMLYLPSFLNGNLRFKNDINYLFLKTCCLSKANMSEIAENKSLNHLDLQIDSVFDYTPIFENLKDLENLTLNFEHTNLALLNKLNNLNHLTILNPSKETISQLSKINISYGVQFIDLNINADEVIKILDEIDSCPSIFFRSGSSDFYIEKKMKGDKLKYSSVRRGW